MITLVGLSQEFDVAAGVDTFAQGDTLAPFTLVFFVDCVLRNAIMGRGEEAGFTTKPP